MSQTLTVKFNWTCHTRSRASAKDATPSSIPQSAAAKSRRKLKEKNPDRHKEYLARDAERKRKHYASTSNKKTDNELKECRRKWAASKREQRNKNKKEHIKAQSTNNNKKRYKDMTPEEKKKYMADKKRESRGKLTRQKKVIIKLKETKRRRISREGDMPQIEEDQSRPTDIMRTPTKTAALKSPPSKATMHRKIAKIKEKLPSSPRTFAAVVSNLVEKASPSKKAELEKRGMLRKCFVRLCKSRQLELFQGSYTGKLSRNLSSIAPEAEPAAPPSIFRTTESDPAKHNQMHLGMYYTVPPEDFAVVFPQIRPKLYAQQVEAFNEACVMIREPALELISYLSSANYSLPAARYLIYGKKGSGKSITLNHVVHYCATQGWLTVHVPDAHLWVKNCRDLLPSTYRQGRYDQPTQAVNWLRKFRISNEKFLKEMKTQKAYTWTKSEFTEEGTFLLDVLDKGIARPRVASDIVGMLFKELKQYSLAKNVRMLVAVDGANSLWGRSVLTKEDKSLIMTEELTLIWNLRKLIRSDWSNGAIVLESNQTGSVFRHVLDYLPTPLFGQEGFDAVDPFVPINVRNYSEKEFESCYMYYMERNWLQQEHVKTEAGKQELKFLCNKNPATMEKLCAFL